MSEKKLDPERCCKRVWLDSRWPSSRQCSRKWKVERDGKRFCNQHDPVKAKERRDTESAKWAAERRVRDEQRLRDIAIVAACEGVPTEKLKPGLLKKLLAEPSVGDSQ